MNWASDLNEQRPSMGQLAIDKSTVRDPYVFKDFVALFDLQIISEEPEYYILDGSTEELQDFAKYWSYSLQ